MRKGILATILAIVPIAGQAFAQQPGNGMPAVLPSPVVSNGVPAPALGLSCTDDRGPACATECCIPACVPACGPPGRFWVSAEYLMWWVKDSNLPPLVTSNATSSLAALGTPGTVTLFGGNDLDNEFFSGGRFTAGFWLNDAQTMGFETSFFFLGERSVGFTAGNRGSPALSRPFFDVVAGIQSAQAVSATGLAGTVQASNSTRLFGFEPNALCNICCSCNYRVDLIGGFRYLQLDEGLGVRENLVVGAIPGLAGTNFNVADQFDTTNRFYGGQLGARAEYWKGRIFANVTGKLALGNTHQTVGISGATIITPAGGVASNQVGGLLAQRTNIGTRTYDQFAVVPEIGFNVGYQVSDHVRAFVGYTFLYWSDVVRPGDQIDFGINPSQIPSVTGPGTLVGPARPAAIANSTDFWAQGINVGMQIRF